MGWVISYFRQRPGQRRLLTATAAVVAGLLAAVVLYPYISDELLIRDLAEADDGRRAKAILRATHAARRSPRFARRLEAALEAEDDVQFAAAVAALRRNGKFEVPGRDPLHVDRMRALAIYHTRCDDDPRSAARTREMILSKVLLSGRRNFYVHKAMTSSYGDHWPAVRRLAALLAARYPHDSGLRILMETDRDPSVVAAAALAAGLAGRRELTDDLSQLLDSAQEPEVVAAAAYSLATCSPGEHSQRICRRLAATEDETLRDKLLEVMSILGDQHAKATTGDILAGFLDRGDLPPAAAIAVGSRLRLAQAERAIQAVAARAADGEANVRESQVIAAFEAAATWPSDVRQSALQFCRRAWGPKLPLALMAAAKASAWPVRADADSRDCEILQRAAAYNRPIQSQTATGPAKWLTTPLPSAAAAVALWRISPPAGREAVKVPASLDQTLPGDYLAWHLGTTAGPQAFALGLEMLPPRATTGMAPQSQPAPVYNENLLATGAMLLAIAAQTPEQIELARGRIAGRLGDREIDLYLRGTYLCALLMLGQDEHLAAVRQLLTVSDFPQRRALTALLAAGDREALDWLLAPGRRTDDYVVFVLLNKALAEVLAACAPELPTVSPWAGHELSSWQVRILRYTYAIRRESIELSLKR